MGAVNTIGDFIRSVFPTIVNKTGKLFKALLADKEYADGTIETIFNTIEKTRKEWSERSVYQQSGEQLDRTLSVFSIIKQLQNESEQTFKNRNKLLFMRSGDRLWGNRQNILNMFKTFYNNQNVYLVNNTEPFADNLLSDGNFEKQDAWILVDAVYAQEARFEETTGIFFNAAGTCSQSVNVERGATYFLHFFMKGNIRVQITDNKSRYWHTTGGEDSDGAWSEHEYAVSFVSKDWTNKSIFFFTDDTVSNVTITFLYDPGYYAFLDYVRLNKKTGASTFTLIAVFDGIYTDETASMAPGRHDDIIQPDYSKQGYFSPGQADVHERDENSISYFDHSAITEGISPIAAEGTNDVEPLRGYENMSYADAQQSLAPDSPVGSDDYKSVDYNKVSYFDSAYIFGATGTEAKGIFQELLDIVQAGGVTSTIELLTREQKA
ncbi:MAG: hypothetical protein ACTTI6_09350 [Treponema sp.]|uniref:hypothetical protein n=1 Tax=Treponema sp. TaxID=166 RepID=UPI003FA1C0BB